MWTRNVLALLTAAALVVHLLFPLAPPWMLDSTGMTDLSAVYGPAVYGDPATDTLANQYAAMPSLHVGWALAVAAAVISATTGGLRWLWLAHPAITLIVVAAIGHHYWLDAMVAVLLLAGAHRLLRHIRPIRSAPPASIGHAIQAGERQNA